MSDPLYKEIKSLGFKKVALVCVTAKESEDYALRPEDWTSIAEWYSARAQAEAERIVGWEQLESSILGGWLQRIAMRKAKLHGCAAGRNYIAISARGDIYPCHRFVGMREWLLGNVKEGIVEEKKRQAFFDRTVDTMPKCQKCWVRYVCGGGCAYESVFYNSDLMVPYEESCNLIRHTFQVALNLYISLYEKDDTLIAGLYQRLTTRGRTRE